MPSHFANDDIDMSIGTRLSNPLSTAKTADSCHMTVPVRLEQSANLVPARGLGAADGQRCRLKHGAG